MKRGPATSPTPLYSPLRSKLGSSSLSTSKKRVKRGALERARIRAQLTSEYLIHNPKISHCKFIENQVEKGDTNIFSRKKYMFPERSLDFSRTFVSCEVKRGLYKISPQATYMYALRRTPKNAEENE